MSDPQSEFVARYGGDEPALLCPAGFPVPPGTKEWAVLRGDRGPKGDKGEPGKTRLPAGVARAIVYLFVLNLILTALCLAGLVRYESDSQASQRRAGELTEQKICTDVGTMARIPAPAGNPATNPSRAYEQAEHRTWAGLLRGLDCR